MKDETIEGLLKNLKQTLENKGRNEYPIKNESSVKNFESEYQQQSVYVLKNPVGLQEDDENKVLRKKAMNLITNEVQNQIVNEKLVESNVHNFFVTDEGQEFLMNVVRKYFENNSEILEKIIRKEIIKKINEAII